MHVLLFSEVKTPLAEAVFRLNDPPPPFRGARPSAAGEIKSESLSRGFKKNLVKAGRGPSKIHEEGTVLLVSAGENRSRNEEGRGFGPCTRNFLILSPFLFLTILAEGFFCHSQAEEDSSRV